MSTAKTEVLFLKHPEDDQLFAYFPMEIWDHKGNLTAYAHIGQHSGCCPEYALECEELTNPAEWEDLRIELKSIGYNIKITNDIQLPF